jgi:hypothetical protein
MAAPVVLDRRAVPFMPRLFANDILPDCTAAGLANAAGAVAALNGYALNIDPTLVPRFYADCVGCAPTFDAMAATDGAVMLDVLRLQAQSGFAIGPQSLAGRSGTIDPTSRIALALGLARFGAGYWGVTLRERDMELGARVWDVLDGRDDGAVVGGHCVIAFDYTGLADTDTVRIGTWGEWRPASWAWVHARIAEAHGVVWRQLARPDGTYWTGLNADRLTAYLS